MRQNVAQMGEIRIVYCIFPVQTKGLIIHEDKVNIDLAETKYEEVN